MNQLHRILENKRILKTITMHICNQKGLLLLCSLLFENEYRDDMERINMFIQKERKQYLRKFIQSKKLIIYGGDEDIEKQSTNDMRENRHL